MVREANEGFQVKIVNFGVSYRHREESVFEDDSYRAPEGLKDHKCDVWACGVILYALLSG